MTRWTAADGPAQHGRTVIVTGANCGLGAEATPVRAAGRRTMSVAAHPGVAATEGMRRDTSLQGRLLAGGPAQTPEMGALPMLYAATEPRVAGGSCIGPDGFMQRSGYPTLVRSSRASRDTTLADQLWQRSELLTGVHYAIEPFAR
jgi:hypothetical protein